MTATKDDSTMPRAAPPARTNGHGRMSRRQDTAEAGDSGIDADDSPAIQASGVPVRHRYAADRAAAAPALAGQNLDRMTGCGYHRAAGMADLRPPVMRPGAEEARQHPSRRGDRLYWPGGRVTTLGGDVVG